MMKNVINSNKTVLVIGGRGFIGKRVVKHLKLLGVSVVVGTRNIRHVPFTDDSIRQVALHKINDSSEWLERLKGIDIVVNAVGVLRERPGETYEQIHHKSLVSLVQACDIRKIRIVHVSAMGIDNGNKSRFSQSKCNGEQVLINSQLDWAIVRPSLVDGEDGYGAKWFRYVAKWPIQFIPSNASGLFAPIDAEDLGEAIARISLKKNQFSNRIYELGGNHNVNVGGYLKLLNPNKSFNPVVVRVPAMIARIVSHIFDVVHFSPYSFGHYELLKFNNFPKVNRLEEVLCRRGRQIGCENGEIDFEEATVAKKVA